MTSGSVIARQTEPHQTVNHLVIFNCDGADCGPEIKRPPLEHDAVLIVYAGAFWKDEQWRCALSLDVLLHPLGNHCSILDLSSQSSRGMQ
jgi:hypothetical protein